MKARAKILMGLLVMILVSSIIMLAPSPLADIMDWLDYRINGKLPRIYVQGAVIRNALGPIILVGCNVRGQAYNPYRDGKYDDWYTYRTTDAERIASYGFNCIRLVTYWEYVETSNSSSEFAYDDAFIEKLRQTVEAYNAKGIYVMIDLHEHPDGHALDRFIPTVNGDDTKFADAFYVDDSPTGAREHLKKVWLKLSETFKNDKGVVYDLLNEPHLGPSSLSDQQVADYWFDIADYVIAALRSAGDDHVIFVNFCPFARSAQFMSRKLADDNVVYEEHFYFGISEVDLSVTNNNYTWLKQQFDNYVKAKMEQFDVPFIMGEQGCGSITITAGDAGDIWLKNVLAISKTSPLMQGWLYWCYVEYDGVERGGGWQATLRNNFNG